MNDDTPLWLFPLVIIFAMGFVLFQAHYFKMPVMSLILGAQPVVSVGSSNEVKK
jgi:hypothetical protein